jgi:RNA recognition motif-containing protein
LTVDRYRAYGGNHPVRNLHIFHLPAEIGDMQLMSLFSPFGMISRVKVMVHRTTGLSKGFGFVEFQRPEHAVLAVAHMDGYKIGKKHLKVTFKR